MIINNQIKNKVKNLKIQINNWKKLIYHNKIRNYLDRISLANHQIKIKQINLLYSILNNEEVVQQTKQDLKNLQICQI